MINNEGEDIASRNYNLDNWTNIESDLLPLLQDYMAKMTRVLRKKFCQCFSERINFQIRKYFKSHKWLEMVEPRDIKNEFFEIGKLIIHANQCLDLLFGNQKKP
jgi:hypothetical protein